MPHDPLYDIIEDAKRLVQAAAHPHKGTVSLSPETEALLDKIVATSPVLSPLSASEPLSIDPLSRLDALEETVRSCQLCGLCEGRTQTVFSEGSPTADLMFIGEAPSEEEDQQGLPFVGPAGQLLTDIITKGMMLKRKDVYLCNVIKCRPPHSRDPLPEEKAACEPYLLQQLDLVLPKVICVLGSHAAKTLLNTDESTANLRGQWHFYHGIPVRVTYHPAYLLRSPDEKRKTWEDVQQIMKVLKGEITPTP